MSLYFMTGMRKKDLFSSLRVYWDSNPFFSDCHNNCEFLHREFIISFPLGFYKNVKSVFLKGFTSFYFFWILFHIALKKVVRLQVFHAWFCSQKSEKNWSKRGFFSHFLPKQLFLLSEHFFIQYNHVKL